MTGVDLEPACHLEVHRHPTLNLADSGHRAALQNVMSTADVVFHLAGEIVHTPVSTEDVSATLSDTACCEWLLGFGPETDLPAVLERLVSSVVEPAMAAS